MRKLWYTTATLAAITLGTVFIGTRAEAMPISPGGVQSAVDTLTVIEKAQFVIDGRRYCWYDDGWQGPGWYWCGYRWRRGLGWGRGGVASTGDGGQRYQHRRERSGSPVLRDRAHGVHRGRDSTTENTHSRAL